MHHKILGKVTNFITLPQSVEELTKTYVHVHVLGGGQKVSLSSLVQVGLK